jgi:uncharacterized protein YndB with AHSA1/START domain
MEVLMPYAFTLSTTVPASAQEIYEAWLDSLAHSAMTGREASMSDEIDAEVSAWDGYITGRNIELVPGERIVQAWRTTQFTDEHDDSIVTVTLEAVDGGTLLTLVHSNVPEDQTSYEQGGWQTHYFEPMQAYFAASRESVETAPKAAAPAPRRARQAARKSAKAKGKAPAAKAAAGRKAAAKKASSKARSKKAASKKKPGRAAARKKVSRSGVKRAKKAKKSARKAAAGKRRR